MFFGINQHVFWPLFALKVLAPELVMTVNA